jgi:hypothetical protein
MAKASPEEQRDVAELIRRNEELGLHIHWASDVRNDLMAIYRAGQDVGFLPGQPSDATIYSPPRAEK